MASRLPLNTLVDLAKESVDDCARRLGAENVSHTRADQQMSMLMDYRQDYVTRLQATLSGGMSASDCQNYQRFISTLDDAISQQRIVLEAAVSRLDAARTAWRDAQRKLNAYETLAARDGRALALASARREQRLTDEFAGRRRLGLADA